MKHSTKLLALLLAIGLIFLAGVQAFGQEWSPEQKEVWQMEIKYWDLYKEGNAKGYMELWHKDVIAWPHWAKNPVRQEGLEKFAGGPWFNFLSYDLKPLAINIFDNFAFIYYRYNNVGAANNQSYSGRIGHLWMKQDGKWKIIGGYSGGGSTQE
jgi:hypothetical protein